MGSKRILAAAAVVLMCWGAMAQEQEFDPDAILALEGEAFEEAVLGQMPVEKGANVEKLIRIAWDKRLRRDDVGETWVFEEIYNIIDRYFHNQHGHDRMAFIEDVEEAVELRPESAQARTVLISIYTDEAWRVRGSGYANTVSDEQWEGFHDFLSRTEKHGELAQTLDNRDPRLYANLLVHAMAISKPQEELYRLLEAGIDLEPRYYRIYSNAAYALTPRWGGGRGDMKRLAEWCVKQTADELGQSAYFLVGLQAGATDTPGLVVHGHELEPTRLLQGYRDAQPFFYIANRSKNMACAFACYGDLREQAAELFAAIDEGPHSEVWPSTAFDAWRAWAQEDAPAPAVLDIHHAAHAGDVNLIKKALDAGDDINAVAPDGSTPLSLAVKEDHWDSVVLLCEKGADPDIYPLTEEPALHKASRVGPPRAVQAILDNDPDPALSTWQKGNSPLKVAADEGRLDIMEVLLPHSSTDLEARNNNGWAVLHAAAEYGYTEMVKRLLEAGADIEVRTNHGSTPLKLAAGEGHLDIVRYLVEQGADIQTANDEQFTALHDAVSAQQRDITEYLVENAPNLVNVSQHTGWTPLQMAATLGYTGIVRTLVDAPNVDLELTNQDGHTPLHLAARVGSTGSVRALVKAGADVNAKTPDGKTPLDIAKEEGHARLAAWLDGQEK